MSGTLALTKAEISRLRRNKRYMIFTVLLPVMFYLIFGKQHAKGYGVSFAAFYMVGMASFGAFSGAFNNNTIRIDIIRVGTVSLANVIGVVVWFAIFVVLSTFAVRSTAETV